MNKELRRISTAINPRKGTWNSETLKTTQITMPSMPSRKYGSTLPSSRSMRCSGVTKMASMVPRSHSRATTRAVSRVPIRVMISVIRPGTRKLRLRPDGLYQMR